MLLRQPLPSCCLIEMRVCDEMRPGMVSFDVCARQCLFSSRWIAGRKQEGAVEKRQAEGGKKARIRFANLWPKTGTRIQHEGEICKVASVLCKSLLPPIHFPPGLSFYVPITSHDSPFIYSHDAPI